MEQNRLSVGVGKKKTTSSKNTSSKNTFIKDLIAGLTVSFAALSLGAAFGTMSGRGAFAGMIGAAVIPIITSLLGGTRLQASGPTAPMTAITALVVAGAYESFPEKVLQEQFITLVILLFGVVMVLLGLLRVGNLIRYVPNAVIIGFMNGIALLIWYDQLAKLIGFAGKEALAGGITLNMLMALGVLALIFLIPVLIKKTGIAQQYRPFFSAILISIIIGSILANVLSLPIEKVELGVTAGSLSEFWGLITGYFPDSRILQGEYILKALPYALQLALLGYLDSLLTSLVVDKMVKERTNRNKELIAQGLANGVAGILQGIPGAQATIRSVLLLKEGAQTRLAGVLIGIFVLIFLIFLKDWVSLIPAAVFAGVLFKAGWDVCDREYAAAYFKRGWIKSLKRNFQMFIIVITTLITVFFDLNIAVAIGTITFYLAQRIFKAKNLTDVEHELADELED